MPPHSRSRLGQAGEALARRTLEERGYALRDANYRCRWGEVDLVMERAGTLVFVEVRTRRSTAFGTPEESVTAAKRRRLAATALHYLDANALDADWRVDLVAIVLNASGAVERISHTESIVGAEDAEAE